MAPGRILRSTSPQQPDDVVGEWPDGGKEAVETAVSRASRASHEWRAARAADRGRALAEAADRMASDARGLAELMVREVGKPITEATGEVSRAVSILRYYAQMALDADGETYPSGSGPAWLFARRRPRGVAGLITPWNFPVAIPIWKLAPALVYGNTVVLKPATDAMACGLRIASYFDLPDGVLQVVSVGSLGASRRQSFGKSMRCPSPARAGLAPDWRSRRPATGSHSRERWAGAMPPSSCRTWTWLSQRR